MKHNIFPWLVEHHYQRNLQEICTPLIQNGRIIVNGKSLVEGSDSNVPYHGFLFLVDGLEVFDTLIREGVINDVGDSPGRLETLTQEYECSTPLLTPEQFFGYLRREEKSGEDGAYIFNSQIGRTVRISELNNNLKLPEGFSLMSRIPHDFVYSDGRKTSSSKIGTKTRIAIKIPVSMAQHDQNVHAYQIKRTPYTDFGMGKVTHFDSDGLREEFFFTPLDESQRIKGIYRIYARGNRALYRTSQEIELDHLSRFNEIYNQIKKVA